MLALYVSNRRYVTFAYYYVADTLKLNNAVAHGWITEQAQGPNYTHQEESQNDKTIQTDTKQQ